MDSKMISIKHMMQQKLAEIENELPTTESKIQRVLLPILIDMRNGFQLDMKK